MSRVVVTTDSGPEAYEGADRAYVDPDTGDTLVIGKDDKVVAMHSPGKWNSVRIIEGDES